MKHMHHKHCCTSHCNHLSPQEQTILHCIAQAPAWSIAQFVLGSTKSDHLRAIALSPIHLTQTAQTMEEVKAHSTILRQLQEKELITLDYTSTLQDTTYAIYYESAVYRAFQDTIAQAQTHPDFVFNTGHMECGIMTLTPRGRKIVQDNTENSLES